MTEYAITLWAGIEKPGRCRDCSAPIVFRVNRKTGKFLPFNPNLHVLHTERDEARGIDLVVVSRDDLHFATCRARKRAAEPRRQEAR